MFSEKLNFFMRLTNTQNSVLSRAIHVDASTISRLRSEKRKLPRQQNFVGSMSVYFAQRIRDDYQKRSSADAVCPGIEWPDDTALAAELISGYLSAAEPNGMAAGSLLYNISHIAGRRGVPELPRSYDKPVSNEPYYYGHEGKRQAIIAFLRTVINAPAPCTLLLFSDENMSWLYEDHVFAKTWAGMLYQVISKGNRIKIIHTINRSFGDMIEAMNKWVPIYMTGMVEPYYYPKLRDGVLRRTLFVAPSLAAVVSNSVGVHTENALNLYIDNHTAVAALEEEFSDYFTLCRPLMKIFKKNSAVHFWQMYSELEEAGGNATLMHQALSIFTMPEWVAEAMSRRIEGLSVERLRSEILCYFGRNIKEFTVTELICLPPVEAVKNGKIPLPLSEFSGEGKIYYTCGEYAAHLKNALDFSQVYKNYHIHIVDEHTADMLVYCKEDSGVILAHEAISTVFAFNEPRMTAAYDDYLTKERNKAYDEKKSILKIQEFLELL